MSNTIDFIRSTIETTLQPKKLEIIDLSDQHKFHRQAPKDQGHYHLIISQDAFTTTNRLEQHRLIYDTLGSAMQNRIHALKITVCD